VFGNGSNAHTFYNSVILIREYFTEIWRALFLTPGTVGSAYRYVRGICCFYLQGGSECYVLWSVYVGTLIASVTPVICRPLKMDTVYSSEMPVSVYCTTRCHILHVNNMKTDHCVHQKTCN
jgi:hypothetical protein